MPAKIEDLRAFAAIRNRRLENINPRPSGAGFSRHAKRQERKPAGAARPAVFASAQAHPYLPWQCLYFLPLPQGQSSLRPTLPQLAGLLGSRSAAAASGTSEALANAISSSPVFGSNLC